MSRNSYSGVSWPLIGGIISIVLTLFSLIEMNSDSNKQPKIDFSMPDSQNIMYKVRCMPCEKLNLKWMHSIYVDGEFSGHLMKGGGGLFVLTLKRNVSITRNARYHILTDTTRAKTYQFHITNGNFDLIMAPSEEIILNEIDIIETDSIGFYAKKLSPHHLNP